jgi:hypothetical protein
MHELEKRNDLETGHNFDPHTVAFAMQSQLRSRYLLSKDQFTEPFEQAFDDQDRAATLRKLASEFEPQVRAASKRAAIFDAFMRGAPRLNEQIEDRIRTHDDVKVELEEKLGLPKGAVEQQTFDEVLSNFSRQGLAFHRRHNKDFDFEKHLDYMRGYGYVQVFITEYVKGTPKPADAKAG